MEIKTLFGLPAHPLIVHVPIVLVPLAAVGAVLMLWPFLRAKIGWATVIIAGIATVFTFLAVGSGEALEGAVERTTASKQLLETHTEMGENLRPWILLLFLVLLGIMLFDHFRAKGAAGGASKLTPQRAKTIGVILSVLSIVFAALSTYWVVKIGHSGAKASWEKTSKEMQRSGGESGDHDD